MADKEKSEQNRIKKLREEVRALKKEVEEAKYKINVAVKKLKGETNVRARTEAEVNWATNICMRG